MKQINKKIIKKKILPTLAILALAFSVVAVTQANAISYIKDNNKQISSVYPDGKQKAKPFDEGNETDDNGGGDHGGDDGGQHGGDNGGMDDGGMGDHEGDHNGEHEEEHERMRYHHGEGNETIESDDNTVKFEDSYPRLEMKYYLNVSGVVYQVQIKVRSAKIFEFVDSNNNNVMDYGEKIYTFDFDEKMWTLTVQNATDANGSLLYIKFSYEYKDNDTHIIVNYLVFNKSIGVYDGGADKVKVEILINSWKWHANDSKLAYMFKAEISVESKIFDGIYNATSGVGDYGMFISLNNQTFVEYSWNNTVVVDGQATNVLNSYIKKYENEVEMEDGESEVQLEIRNIVVFPRFNSSLYYDPIIGFEDDPQDVSALATQFNLTIGTSGGTGLLPDIFNDGMLVALGLISSMIIILIGAALVRRRNN